jgi:HPt (histidine-containing phosphotransfer) domain-containing protein
LDSKNIDMEAALARVGGDQDLLRELAELFIEECPGMLGNVDQAFRGGDTRALEFAAHTLKGAIGNFGAGEAYHAAHAIEAAARQGKLDEAGRLIEPLERALESMKLELLEITSGKR